MRVGPNKYMSVLVCNNTEERKLFCLKVVFFVNEGVLAIEI